MQRAGHAGDPPCHLRRQLPLRHPRLSWSTTVLGKLSWPESRFFSKSNWSPSAGQTQVFSESADRDTEKTKTEKKPAKNKAKKPKCFLLCTLPSSFLCVSVPLWLVLLVALNKPGSKVGDGQAVVAHRQATQDRP